MAREVLFWPGMRKSIQDMCDACTTCAQYGHEAQKEPMKSMPIPTQPWQYVSQDLFTFENSPYLVSVCHYSDWMEVDKLNDTLSSTIVSKTKTHFSRLGIPTICHSDNGPQFISKEYEAFASEYGFLHTTSSPYHPKGNGRAEAAVKLCKSMLKKSEDFDLAMLAMRNTPPRGHTYSPAQRIFGRRTRTILPTPDHLLIPHSPNLDKVTQEICKKRELSKSNYDKSAGKELPYINIGSYVYAKPPPHLRGKPWSYGKITGKQDRSYTIQTPSSTIGRNRVQIRPAAPPPPSTKEAPQALSPLVFPTIPVYSPPCNPDPPSPSPNMPSGKVASTTDPSSNNTASHTPPSSPADPICSGTISPPVPYVTRSGRVVKTKKILDM
jgi:hypothetical protein